MGGCLCEQDRQHLVKLDVDVEGNSEEIDDVEVSSETFEGDKLTNQNFKTFRFGFLGVFGAGAGGACGWDLEGKSVTFAQAGLNNI